MIWNSVLNAPPEIHCKCEVLLMRKDGNLEQFFSEYDAVLRLWLLPQITEENSKLYNAVHYWRAL